MFLLIFLSFVFAIDEGLFGNGCLCSVRPDECTPYCACDPFCTESEKSTFHFTIPQKITENNVACDTAHKIYKFRSSSVSTFKAAVEGDPPTCYYYQPTFKKSQSIKSYSPEDFGLEGFADAIKLDSPGIIIEVQDPLIENQPPQAPEPIITDHLTKYLKGKPVECYQQKKLFVDNDNYMPVLFGVDSNYIFNFESSGISSLNNTFNLTHMNISPTPSNNNPAITYCYSSKNTSTRSINVFWTFFFQKIGTNNDYSYIIRKVKSEWMGPSDQGNYTANIQIRFIEVSSNGEGILEIQETKLYSYSASNFFQSIFGRDEDSLKSAGILFCIGFLWTLWAYYSFIFTSD